MHAIHTWRWLKLWLSGKLRWRVVAVVARVDVGVAIKVPPTDGKGQLLPPFQQWWPR